MHSGSLNSTDIKCILHLDMHLYATIRYMYLYHACQRTKEDNSLLFNHYTWICILGILSITEDIRSCPILSRLPFARNRSWWWSGAAMINQPVQLQTRIYQMILSSWFYEKSYWRPGAARVFVQRRTKISRILSWSRISRATQVEQDHLETGDAALYWQLFTDLL